MALSIKNPETERLARQLATVTGESLTDAITVALRERLARVTGKSGPCGFLEEIRDIQGRVAAIRVLERGPDEQLIGK
jgi:antitoxin VapB